MKKETYCAKKRLCLSVLFFILFLFTGIITAGADSKSDFDKFLDKLEKDRIIKGGGKTESWGDFEDEWARLGWYQWYNYGNAERFVLYSHINWQSAHDRPNTFDSGCGVIFNTRDSNNHLLASVRMDGFVYFDGYKGGYYISNGKYWYGKASTKGSVDFALVVDHDKASVYINGERIVRKADLYTMGDTVGLCTLSGTNKDYGTRCVWDDIYFYTW